MPSAAVQTPAALAMLHDCTAHAEHAVCGPAVSTLQRDEDLARCRAVAEGSRQARLRESVLTVDTEAERNTALMLDPFKPRECLLVPFW